MNYSSLSKLKSYINSSIVLIFFTILALVCANTPIIQLLNKERAQKNLLDTLLFIVLSVSLSTRTLSPHAHSLHTHTLSTRTLLFSPPSLAPGGYLFILAHESLRVTVRLKTRCSAVESVSAQK